MEYDGIGDNYQNLTKYTRGSLPRHYLDWSNKPSLKRTFPGPVKTIKLPKPATGGGPPIWQTICARRSERGYLSEPITMEQLSQLLWATQGETHGMQGHAYRAAPSAGALYPVETYVVANRVEGLDAGLYHYDSSGAGLQLLKKGELGPQIAAAALDQPMAETAGVVFIWTAIPGRGKWKYLERAYRYIYLDAGHIAQNLYLAATALGLGCCAIGALYDDEVNRLVGADGEEETAIYMCAVGRL